jgi:hypothetical protein
MWDYEKWETIMITKQINQLDNLINNKQWEIVP